MTIIILDDMIEPKWLISRFRTPLNTQIREIYNIDHEKANPCVLFSENNVKLLWIDNDYWLQTSEFLKKIHHLRQFFNVNNLCEYIDNYFAKKKIEVIRKDLDLKFLNYAITKYHVYLNIENKFIFNLNLVSDGYERKIIQRIFDTYDIKCYKK